MSLISSSSGHEALFQPAVFARVLDGGFYRKNDENTRISLASTIADILRTGRLSTDTNPDRIAKFGLPWTERVSIAVLASGGVISGLTLIDKSKSYSSIDIALAEQAGEPNVVLTMSKQRTRSSKVKIIDRKVNVEKVNESDIPIAESPAPLTSAEKIRCFEDDVPTEPTFAPYGRIELPLATENEIIAAQQVTTSFALELLKAADGAWAYIREQPPHIEHS